MRLNFALLTSVLAVLSLQAKDTATTTVPPTSIVAPGAPDWENHTVFRINKEAARADKTPFPSAAAALAGPRSASPWRESLNGDWRIHWSPTPEGVPTGFEQPSFDTTGWRTISVPSNVEIQGFGTPIYTNIVYPFHRDAPRVMGEPKSDWTTFKERNPVSCYRRTFTVPAAWNGRQTFIVFNGVASAFRLWVNGHEIGYSEDSRTPAEFNITPHLQPGENTLAVQVWRYSDGAYLEDQDFWRLSGIFRDVYLWSSDALDLRDFELHATLADDYRTGVLSVTTRTRNLGHTTTPYTIEASLLNAKNLPLASLKMTGSTPADASDHIASASLKDLDIEPWSAESPRLYPLVLTLRDASGREIADYVAHIGFRRSEIKDGQYLVNGRPILFKGVNRHDFNQYTGQYVSEENMRADLAAMKRLNINAIRTCHYPNDPAFLDLVDQYGFYVISEANIETHGYGNDAKNPIAHDATWYPALRDRVSNMMELLKNHPSIVTWSPGNEAGYGPNFERLLAWMHERDPSRPVQYEPADERPSTSYFCPMYFTIDKLEPWCRQEEKNPLAAQRPLIQCEYNHSMGNSDGGLSEYWRLIRKERLLQGGFIWDWRDQGLVRETPAGHPLTVAQSAVAALDPARFVAPDGRLRYFAYGGDFGDLPNDNNFCINGIMGPDLKPNPHAIEVAYQYRNLLVTPVDLTPAQPRVSVFNENFFVAADNQPYRWTLLENGRPVQTGEGKLPKLAPQSSAELTVKLSEITRKADAEYHLNLEFLQGADHAWAPADHVVAHEQLALAWSTPSALAALASTDSAPDLVTANGRTTVTGSGFSAVLDDGNGQLISYRVADRELLVGPLALNLWRAPTDNDRGNGMPDVTGLWREAGPHATVTARVASADTGLARLRYELSVPVGQTTATVAYVFARDGRIDITTTLRPAAGTSKPLPVIPRVGLSAALNPDLRQWTWFGRGPEENYRDRKSGYPLGVWSGDVAKLWFPYVEPQETANRTDVRWTQWLDAQGRGLRVLADSLTPLEVSSYPFAQSDLEHRVHPAEIPLRDFITIQLAHAQMGVGGENSWGRWPLPVHQLHADHPYTFTFHIEPAAP